MESPTFKRPTALVPVAMSVTALAVVLLHLAAYGAHRQTDEGTAAHLFQILMAGQLPFIAFFAVRWVPRSPARGIKVLALQCGAALAALAPVYLLHL